MQQIKQSTKRWFEISYPWLSTNEVIVSVTSEVLTEDESAEDANAPLWPILLTEVGAGGQTVRFLAGGDGIEGNVYHAKITVATSLQQETTDCYKFLVKGDC